MQLVRLFALIVLLDIASPAVAQSVTPKEPLAEEEVAFSPHLLSEKDISLYGEIFSLQERGQWSRADKKIAALENEILLGYVQHQRYMHPTAYHSKYPELKKWMAYYADHPEADKIYALARKRRPSKAGSPLRPIGRKWRSAPKRDLHPDIKADYASTSGPRLRQIEGRIRHLTNKEQALVALKEIDRHWKRRVITERQYDRMRSWIAASLYYQGYIDVARNISNEAAKRNGDTAVLSYWIAGIIAYRDGNMDEAFAHFSHMAAVPYQEDSLRAAAGFWAARTALANGQYTNVTPSLEIAAALPFTFYGQLALAQLGQDYDYNWETPKLSAQSYEKLASDHPRIRRVIALVEVGKTTEAETELRWTNGSIEPELDRDLLALAHSLDLPASQIDIALASDGEQLETGLFPVPNYTPNGGFKIDRALLYALMRQESKFKTEATSRVGARGLMQLMPRTASYVAKDRSLRRRDGRDRLYDPSFNMALGQTYVGQLIDTAAKGDLFHLAAAYNGGPGNLRRWKRKLEIDDPLLFIESIPNRESRDFVEHVLTNFWIYRARLGQAAPSREKVAAGELPLYEALDQIAEN